MKTHSQKMLGLKLETLQAMAVSDRLDQEHLKGLLETLEQYQQEGHPLATDYKQHVEAARQSCEFVSEQIAKIKAEIMELCHE